MSSGIGAFELSELYVGHQLFEGEIEPAKVRVEGVHRIGVELRALGLEELAAQRLPGFTERERAPPLLHPAFGGQGRGFTADARALTQIEMNIINKLATRIFADLEATWEPVARVEITEVALESDPEFIQIASPQDGVLVVAFEANARSATGLVHICYPLSTLDPLLPRLGPQPQGRDRRDPDHLKRQQRALGKMMIPIEVEVARGALPLDELAGLRVGDVVMLDTTTKEAAIVYVGDRPKYLGRVGLQGSKRAVKITERIDPESEELYK